MQYGTAGNINELYDTVDSEVVLSILVHKVNSSQLPSLYSWHGLFYILCDKRGKVMNILSCICEPSFNIRLFHSACFSISNLGVNVLSISR